MLVGIFCFFVGRHILNWLSLSWFRDLSPDPRKTHSHCEGWHLLSPLLFECGQFQRGPGGASSDEESVWECRCGPTGTGLSQTKFSGCTRWMTSSVPTERDSGHGFVTDLLTELEHFKNLRCKFYRLLIALELSDGQLNGDTQFYLLLTYYCCIGWKCSFSSFPFVTWI